MKTNVVLIFITAPDGRRARRLADMLVKSRLVACVNIVPAISSLYWWKGKREVSRESLLIAKTRRPLFRRLESLVKSAHPYDVPEILALDVSAGHAPYLQWISAETDKPGARRKRLR